MWCARTQVALIPHTTATYMPWRQYKRNGEIGGHRDYSYYYLDDQLLRSINQIYLTCQAPRSELPST